MQSINHRILQLLEILKATGVIRYDKEFCDEIELLKQNLIKIKSGDSGFTVIHLNNIVKKYNVNANWIFGANDQIFRKTNTQTNTQKSFNQEIKMHP